MIKRIPLLSICIPTYNREKYLKECLESIVSQEGFNEVDIEIIISDNASIDNTTLLVKEYQKKFKNIKYFRNDTNVGPVRNILKLPNYANGEYIWFLSDDDMMNAITISMALKTIQDQRPGLILSKMFGFWDGTKIDLEKTNKDGKIISLTGMESFLDFLATVHYDITPYMMTFSIFCFKKELYIRNLNYLLEENGLAYNEVLSNDYFPHSRIIFLPFGNQEKIIIIEKDLILCRGNNISWSFRFSVCQDLLRLIKDLKRNYKMSKTTYHKMKNVYYYSVFTYVIITHIQKYIPASIYGFCVSLGRRCIKLVRELRRK